MFKFYSFIDTCKYVCYYFVWLFNIHTNLCFFICLLNDSPLLPHIIIIIMRIWLHWNSNEILILFPLILCMLYLVCNMYKSFLPLYIYTYSEHRIISPIKISHPIFSLIYYMYCSNLLIDCSWYFYDLFLSSSLLSYLVSNFNIFSVFFFALHFAESLKYLWKLMWIFSNFILKLPKSTKISLKYHHLWTKSLLCSSVNAIRRFSFCYSFLVFIFAYFRSC